MALARRLEEHGVGLESAFAALNSGGQPAGVTPAELQAALARVFQIHCPEDVRAHGR
jgi:exonuclease VII small subunit